MCYVLVCSMLYVLVVYDVKFFVIVVLDKIYFIIKFVFVMKVGNFFENK